jgi:hypothetical protein
MKQESGTGTELGNTQQGVVFAASFDMKRDPSVQSYPEAMLLSKSSETVDRVCYRLVSIQTGESTDGLAGVLLAMVNQSMGDGSEN